MPSKRLATSKIKERKERKEPSICFAVVTKTGEQPEPHFYNSSLINQTNWIVEPREGVENTKRRHRPGWISQNSAVEPNLCFLKQPQIDHRSNLCLKMG